MCVSVDFRMDIMLRVLCSARRAGRAKLGSRRVTRLCGKGSAIRIVGRLAVECPPATLAVRLRNKVEVLSWNGRAARRCPEPRESRVVWPLW